MQRRNLTVLGSLLQYGLATIESIDTGADDTVCSAEACLETFLELQQHPEGAQLLQSGFAECGDCPEASVWHAHDTVASDNLSSTMIWRPQVNVILSDTPLSHMHVVSCCTCTGQLMLTPQSIPYIAASWL